MKRAELARVIEIENSLRDYEQALKRCAQGTFKAAMLAVSEVAHGANGTDNRPQQAESRILLDREEVEAFLRRRIDQLSMDLMRLGVED